MFENNNVVVWQKGKNRITISKKNRLYRAEQKILFFWTHWFYTSDRTFRSSKSSNKNDIFKFFLKLEYLKDIK
jgi:hypothetical protein